MITTEKLTELCDRAYRAACDKGFHDELWNYTAC